MWISSGSERQHSVQLQQLRFPEKPKMRSDFGKGGQKKKNFFFARADTGSGPTDLRQFSGHRGRVPLWGLQSLGQSAAETAVKKKKESEIYRAPFTVLCEMGAVCQFPWWVKKKKNV